MRRARAAASLAWFLSKVQKELARRVRAEATCKTSKARVPRRRVWVRAMRRAEAKVAAEMGTMRIAPAWISLENASRTACSSEARNSLRKMRPLSALKNSNSTKSVARRGGLMRFMIAAAAEELASGT